MRSLSVALLLLLVGCGPALSSFTPRERLVDLGQPGFSLPVEAPSVAPAPPVVVPPEAPPVVGRPVLPPGARPVHPVQPPVEPIEPTLPVEPVEPVRPPSEPPNACRVLTLPAAAAVESITKCPRAPADLTFR